MPNCRGAGLSSATIPVPNCAFAIYGLRSWDYSLRAAEESSGQGGNEGEEGTSGSVPIAAIVAPIAAVVLLAGVGIVVYVIVRRRRTAIGAATSVSASDVEFTSVSQAGE